MGQQDLGGSRGEKVVTAHDFGDAHQEIVHRTGKRIPRAELIAGERKIAKRPRDILLVMPRKGVIEGDNGIFKDSESPTGRSRTARTSRVSRVTRVARSSEKALRLGPRHEAIATSPRIVELLARVRRGLRRFDIAP